MCIFRRRMRVHVTRRRVVGFFLAVIPFDLWLRPPQASELIERAVSHYVVAKHSDCGVGESLCSVAQRRISHRL